MGGVYFFIYYLMLFLIGWNISSLKRGRSKLDRTARFSWNEERIFRLQGSY